MAARDFQMLPPSKMAVRGNDPDWLAETTLCDQWFTASHNKSVALKRVLNTDSCSKGI